MNDLAKRCKMSPANVLYHFKNRNVLLRTLLEHITENNWRIVAEGIKPENDAYQNLLNHFEMNLAWAKRCPEEAHIILQIYSEASHDKEFADTFALMLERAQDRIHRYLLAGQRESLFHFEMPSKDLARFLHNVLVGSFINTMGLRLKRKGLGQGKELDRLLRTLVKYRATG
jgi:AcrR family transcriptional regulator